MCIEMTEVVETDAREDNGNRSDRNMYTNDRNIGNVYRYGKREKNVYRDEQSEPDTDVR